MGGGHRGVPEGFTTHLRADSPLLNLPDTEASQGGILFVAGQPFLVASRPIITSEDLGPIRGTLIMGRRIDDRRISAIGRRTGVPTISDVYVAARDSVVLSSTEFVAPGVPAQVLTLRNAVLARGLLRDVYGNPGIVLSTYTDRSVHRQGMWSLRLFIVLLIVTVLVVGMLSGGLLQRYVLRRLRSISEEVGAIAVHRDFSARVTEDGKDELTDLAESMNAMLDSLRDAHNEMGDERKFLQLLIENQGEGVAIVDLQETFTFSNPVAEQVFGVEPGTLVGRNLSEFASSEMFSLVRRQTEERRNGLTSRYEMEIVRPDGEQRTLMVTATPHMDAHGEHVGSFGVFSDDTERVQAKRALEESEARFRSLFEHAAVGIARLGRDGRFGNANAAAERILGYSREELAGLPFTDVTYADETAEAVATFDGLLRGDADSHHLEIRFVRNGGDVGWGSLILSAVRDPDGSLEFIVCMLEDVTEKRLAEGRYRLLTTAVEQTGEIIIITDTEFVAQYANPAFEEITGYDRSEMTGRDVALLWVDADTHPLEGEIGRHIAEGRVWSGRIANRKSDGEAFFSDATISPVRDDSGEITSVVLVFNDITVQTDLEQRLQQANKMEAVGRLAGGIAHDFNNLLTIITAHAELLAAQTEHDDVARARTEEIVAASGKGADLVHRLLTFGRKAVIAPHVVNVNAIIIEVERFLKRIIGEDIDFSMSLAPELRNVRADSGQIEQVLLNLASNSRDAMPSGGHIVIGTEDVELAAGDGESSDLELREGGYSVISVSDDGVGMDEETRSRIFEPFFSTKRDQGTGLGLASAYGVVAQHGGAIQCESEPGSGTTFRIYLPAVDEEVAVEARDDDERVLTGDETILVVEDEASILAVSKELLEDSGYTVITAPDVAQALNASTAHDGRIDLLFTDLVLPDGNGRELSEELCGERPDMRVLFTSGYSDSIVARHGVLERGLAFLQKPYHLDDLLVKIRDVLDAPSPTGDVADEIPEP